MRLDHNTSPPMQFTTMLDEPKVEVFPYSWQSELAREKAIDSFRRTPLSLTAGPLFQVSLWESADSRQDMVIKWHHLVADGRSLQILLNDFLLIYEQGIQPTPKPTGYREYVSWLENRLDNPEGEKDLEYWRQDLADITPLHNLSTIRKKRTGKHFESRTLQFSLPECFDLWPSFLPYEVVLGAFIVLLRAYSGQEDISLLVPLNGRPHGPFESIVGHFVNIGIIRVDLSQNDHFENLLAAVRRKLKQAVKHQFYPFPKIVEKLGLTAPTGHSPISDAYCGLAVLPEGLPEVNTPKAQKANLLIQSMEQAGVPWDIALEVYSDRGGHYAVLRCRKDIWDSDDVESIAKSLTAILSEAGRKPTLPFSRLSWLSEEEQDRLRRGRLPTDRNEIRPDHSAPETATEEILHRIFKKVLGGVDIGVKENFFTVGGHSLMAIQVIAQIAERFRIDLPLNLLFEHGSIRDLAAYVDNQSNGKSRIMVLKKSDMAATADEKTRLAEYPLSFSQERMWFLSRLEPESAAYNIHVALRLKGVLDIQALDTAFQVLQTRHEILRTTFHENKGRPVQKVHPHPLARLHVIDLTAEDAPDAAAEARRRLESAVVKPFKLDEGPIIRMILIELATGDVILTLNLHHIIGDQWSMGIIARELTAVYQAVRENRNNALPPLPFQYKDFALQQRAVETNEKLAQQSAYWLKKMSGIGTLELPFDHRRPPVHSGLGGAVRWKLTQNEIDAVRSFCQERAITPFMFLLACFAALLHRYSNSQDFPVGIPIANRTNRLEEQLIGTFVNTLVFRLTPRENSSFTALLEETRKTAVEAFQYQDYPFERLVNKLKPVRSLDHSPLFQVLFNMANTPLGEFLPDGLSVEPITLEIMGAQFDLIQNIELEFTREITLCYNRNLFDRVSIERMATHYKRILREALDDPDQKLQDIPILDEVERRTVLDDWNNTTRDYPLDLTLPWHLSRIADTFPTRTALISNGTRIIYRDLFSSANRLANLLCTRHIGPGSVVGVNLTRGPRMITTLLGIMKTGAAYLPLDPAYPRARVEYMVHDSGLGLVISEGNLMEQFDFPSISALLYEEIEPELASYPDSAPPLEWGSGTLAYILYTSGSTGNPKGVAVSHRALVNFLFSMNEEPGFEADDGLLAITPISFDISGLELYLPLLSGGKLFLEPRETSIDPMALQKMLTDSEVTVMQATPSTWRMLLESGWSGRLKKILCGGEAFPPDLIPALFEHCDELWNLYGPTETTIWSTCFRVVRPEDPISIGRPIANTQVHILDHNLEPVPVGAHGDLYIGGEGLAKGYYKQPDLTAKLFIPHPWRSGRRLYRTGDRARYFADGTIEFLGRSDSQVKLHGFRIELGEIETVLTGHPAIRQAVCTVSDSGSGDARLAAYCVPRDRDRGLPENDEIRKYLTNTLPPFMIPKIILSVESFPLTASGKIEREALPPPRILTSFSNPPDTETEHRLLGIWREVLGTEGFGVENDFFKLGGHSLSAVRLVALVSDEYGVDLPLRSLFLDPTVRGMARVLENLLHNRPADSAAIRNMQETDVLFPMQPEGTQPPLFLIAGMHSEEDGMYRYLSSMVHYVGTDQPIYGLRPRGLQQQATLYKSIVEMAADYITHIRVVQPAGPYRLAGECIGGLVAYEVARQLTSQGNRISSLLLLDTEYPRPLRKNILWIYRRIKHKVLRSGEFFVYLIKDPARLSEEIHAYLRRRKVSWFPRTDEEWRKLNFQKINSHYHSIARRYKLTRYGGTVQLMVNEVDHQRYPNLGWKADAATSSRVGPKEIETVEIRGDHVSRLTAFGPETGKAIRRIIDGV